MPLSIKEGELEMPVYALRDIRVGEELTEKYSDYEDAEDKDNVLEKFEEIYHPAENN